MKDNNSNDSRRSENNQFQPNNEKKTEYYEGIDWRATRQGNKMSMIETHGRFKGRGFYYDGHNVHFF